MVPQAASLMPPRRPEGGHGRRCCGLRVRGQGVRTEREHVQCDVCIGAAHRMRLKKVIVFFSPLEAHVLLENSAWAADLLKILK